MERQTAATLKAAATKTPRRIVTAFLLQTSVLALLVGCTRRAAPPHAAMHVAVHFDRAHPVVGANALTLRLADDSGQPLKLRDPALEADMNHAGMTPVFAKLQPTGDGQYAGTIEFTMGGDWFLLVSGQMTDGAHFEAKVDVPAVQAR